MPRFRRFFAFREGAAWWAGPILLSGALRFFHLSRSSYWLDEMVSLDLASQHGIRALFSDNNPPLYHLVLKSWVLLLGSGEIAARSFSVLCSMVATYFVMKAVQQIRNDRTAIALAGVLHAVCILSLTHAQEARMYAFFEMWMAMSLYFFFELFRTRKHLLGYCLSCVGMALTHYLGIIPIALELSFLLFSPRALAKSQKILLVLMLLSLAGIQGWIYHRFFKWDGLQWQLMKTSAEPLSFWPRELLLELGNRSLLAALVMAAAWGLGIYQLFMAKEEERVQRLSLVALVLLPIATFSMVTLVTGRALLLPRYFIFLVPPFCVFLGLVELQYKRLIALAAGIFAVGCVTGLYRYYSIRKEPWRDAAEIVAKYPHSVVFTTRTLALRTPYFERIGVPVKSLDLGGTASGIAALTSEVAQGNTVWILENFWGGYAYMPELKQVLSGLHLEVSELSLRDGASPPVLVIMVESKKS